MQRIGLQLRATLENITRLRAEGEDFRWYLKVRRAGAAAAGSWGAGKGRARCSEPVRLPSGAAGGEGRWW